MILPLAVTEDTCGTSLGLRMHHPPGWLGSRMQGRNCLPHRACDWMTSWSTPVFGSRSHHCLGCSTTSSSSLRQPSLPSVAMQITFAPGGRAPISWQRWAAGFCCGWPLRAVAEAVEAAPAFLASPPCPPAETLGNSLIASGFSDLQTPCAAHGVGAGAGPGGAGGWVAAARVPCNGLGRRGVRCMCGVGVGVAGAHPWQPARRDHRAASWCWSASVPPHRPSPPSPAAAAWTPCAPVGLPSGCERLVHSSRFRVPP